MRHLNNFLGHLQGVRRRGRGWAARCPLHADEKPSLSISLGESNRVIFCCHVCGRERATDIITAMGLTWRDTYAKGRDRFVTTGCQAERLPTVISEDDADLRNRVYSYLASHTYLVKEDADNLAKRGLSPAHIFGDGYFSLQSVAKACLLRLYRDYGPALYRVPGLREGATGSPMMGIRGGLFIPVRNTARQIIAGLVRTGGRPKYLWMRGSGAPCHAPLVVTPAETVWITEGPLKADVVACIGGLPVVGVSGVASWTSVIPVLLQGATSRIVIAYDADWHTKPAVCEQMNALKAALLRKGYRVAVAEWDLGKGKGLDDLLLAGGRYNLVEVSSGR